MRNDIANKDGIGARMRQSKRVTRKASINTNQENQVKMTSKMDINKAQKRSISDNCLATTTTTQTRKRTAFGDITNAIQAHANRMSIARSKSMNKDPKAETKPELKKAELKRAKSLVTKEVKCEPLKTKTMTATKRNTRLRTSKSTTSLPVVPIFVEDVSKDNTKSEKEMSIDEQCEEILSCPVVLEDKSSDDIMDVSCKEVVEELPEGVVPFDLDEDPNVVSEYAADIFKNMKKREARFPVANYLTREGTLTTGMMRAILVDWLVEVQENFELYHETLYFAVKIVDYYLQNNSTPKEKLQLVGATALLIASKIEERQPPPLDDFQFICDDAYTNAQFKEMEIRIFKALDFDINMPISYRFLRRFSRVTQMKMEVLTLARYILELSLHGAEFVDKPPSQMAASCLCLAMKMKDIGEWNPNHIYHSGYEEKELVAIMKSLNQMLIDAPNHKLQTVRTKYSHPVHFEVAKTKTIDMQLLEKLS